MGIPVVAAEQPIVEFISKIKGSPLYPECRIGDSVVKTFDNSTYTYELDGCYHVLVADSSKQSYFAVLAKELEGKKEVKLFIHETEVVLKPTRSYTVQNKEYEILVDGQRIEIRPSERKEIPTKSRSVVLKLIRSPDDVLILETPYLRVIYDGELVEVKETSILVQRDLKGLCGTNNGDQRNDVLTPTSKVASTYQAAAISQRVGKSCPSLTQQQQIYKEQLRFAKEPRIEKVKVTQFLKSKLEKCSEMMHSTVWQGPSFCISQIPVLSAVLDALQGRWSPNLCHSHVCQPLVRELSDCMKRRSGVETSSLNLGTCKNLSPPRCLFQFLAPTQDFKLYLY